jgi:hypothetical protein
MQTESFNSVHAEHGSADIDKAGEGGIEDSEENNDAGREVNSAQRHYNNNTHTHLDRLTEIR